MAATNSKQNSGSGNGERRPFDVSMFALVKVVVVVAAVAFLMKVFGILLLFVLGVFLAVSLDPVVSKMQKLGLHRNVAVLATAVVIFGFLAVVAFVIFPDIYNQLSLLVQEFPKFRDELLHQLPGDSRFKRAIAQAADNPKWLDTATVVTSAAFVFNYLVKGVTEIALVFIFSIYLLRDGRRAFRWICDFFSAPVRMKLQVTASEASEVIYGYVMGQIITSLLAGVFCYLVLASFSVPAALTLGVLACFLDIIPVIGFILAVIPATLLALTVSPTTAVWVFLLYGLYHSIENNVLIPWIYGSRMKVSSLVVMLALLIAGTVGGVVCAIAILPVVASYPIIERIWLVKYLGRGVVTKHATTAEDPMSEHVKLWMEKSAKPAGAQSGLSGREKRKALARKVMIVEDDDDVRAMLVYVLEGEGYETLVASNGREGLETLSRNSDIGLILLDIMMPVMDGRTFLDQIKRLESPPPVVFLSASIDSINTEGAVGVLRKTSQIDSVLETVDRHYANGQWANPI